MNPEMPTSGLENDGASQATDFEIRRASLGKQRRIRMNSASLTEPGGRRRREIR
jgi:hypothetical protein